MSFWVIIWNSCYLRFQRSINSMCSHEFHHLVSAWLYEWVIMSLLQFRWFQAFVPFVNVLCLIWFQICLVSLYFALLISHMGILYWTQYYFFTQKLTRKTSKRKYDVTCCWWQGSCSKVFVNRSSPVFHYMYIRKIVHDFYFRTILLWREENTANNL